MGGCDRELVLALDIGSGACKGSLVLLPPPPPLVEATRTPVVSTPSIPPPMATVIYGREATSLLGHAVAATVRSNAATGPSIPAKAVENLFVALRDIFTEAEDVFHAYVGCPSCRERVTAHHRIIDVPLYTVPRVSLAHVSAPSSIPPLAMSHDEAQVAWNAVQKFGVCTAVFRKTVNGAEVLRSVESHFRCSLQIASQQQEGLLGYRTGIQAALASQLLLKRPSSVDEVRRDGGDNVLIWDSGGASFQLTAVRQLSAASMVRRKGDGAAMPLGCNTVPPSQSKSEDHGRTGPQLLLAAYEGNWGSSQAVKSVVCQVQGRQFPMDSANPMSLGDVHAAIKLITDDLSNAAAPQSSNSCLGGNSTAMSASEVRQLLAGQEEAKQTASSSTQAVENSCLPSSPPRSAAVAVMGIGGPTCAFRMCALLCHPQTDITPSRLMAQLEAKIVGKTDAEVETLGFPQAAMVGPKVCLVVAVMRFVGMQSFRYLPTVGSTLGIAASRNELMMMKQERVDGGSTGYNAEGGDYYRNGSSGTSRQRARSRL